MSDPYEALEAARSAFKAFERDTVHRLTGLDEVQARKLSFAEQAKRIHDAGVRRRYCELAIEMIDANIAFYRSFATSMPPPTPNHTLVVASTLAVAAAVEYEAGLASALFASAVWYYAAAEAARSGLVEKRKHAEHHNKEAHDWAKTITDWQADRSELSTLKLSFTMPA